ncbi:MAG: hypothetical protein EKK64_10290 [Neisseriaceae bacterium]|nr:MAG: hypothetical protein EKK64_10290 [Neisseriaceae bacterium]
MNEDLNWLLTDEFVSFSNKIKEIVELKKAKKAELKSFYEKTQNELKKLEEEATIAQEEFETFKSSSHKKED